MTRDPLTASLHDHQQQEVRKEHVLRTQEAAIRQPGDAGGALHAWPPCVSAAGALPFRLAPVAAKDALHTRRPPTGGAVVVLWAAGDGAA